MPHSTLDDSLPSPKDADEDIDLPDAPPLNEHVNNNGIPSANDTQKQDVKLEDLFNDEDSDDEEFPNSSISNEKMESSPPGNPL